MTLKKKTSTPTRRSKLAIAVRDRQPCDGTRCRGSRRLDATARNHRDGAEPDPSDTTPLPSRAPTRVARAAPGRNRERPPEPQAAPAAAAPQPGVLPIVTDQFATVTVVPNEEFAPLRRRTLGDLLFAKPGITGSSFAPGASSRPIIRGLDVNRVGIVDNGVGGGGVSDLGEDHFVPIDPLATNQIEVIRGPATLRYGSPRSAASSAPPTIAFPTRCPPARLRRSSLRPAGQGTACRRAASPCMNVEMRTAVSSGRSWPRRRHAARRRRRQFRGSRRCLSAARPATTASRLSVSVRARPGLQRDGSRTRRRSRTAPRSAAPISSTAALSARRSRRTTRSIAFRALTAQISTPASTPSRPNSRPRANSARTPRRSTPIRFWAGATDYKHNEIGLADPADPSPTACARPSPTRSRKAASKCS